MKIELCVSSFKGIELAAKYSFDRIELCQNLEIGGTTPSLGLVEQALNQQVETHLLIRPRLGGFVYEEADFQTILSDIRFYRNTGVKGFVVGLFNAERELQLDRLKKIVEVADGADLTFHRGFDDLANWQESIEALFHLGFKRILTSGLSSSVDVGMKNLGFIKDACRGKIELMIGGGVHAGNVGKIISELEPDAIHFSASSIVIESVQSQFNVPRLEIEEDKLKAIMAQLTLA